MLFLIVSSLKYIITFLTHIFFIVLDTNQDEEDQEEMELEEGNGIHP